MTFLTGQYVLPVWSGVMVKYTVVVCTGGLTNVDVGSSVAALIQ